MLRGKKVKTNSNVNSGGQKCPPYIYGGCDTPLFLTLGHAIFLFAAAMVGGALNAVAGGGSFISFPALLFTGVPPIPANATNNIAMWTAAAASGGAYRKHLDVPRRVMIPLLA